MSSAPWHSIRREHSWPPPRYDNTIILWSLTRPDQPIKLKTLSEHTNEVYAVAFSGDGKTMASASADHQVILWDVTNASAPGRAATLTYPNEVYALAFGPDGLLAAGGFAQSVLLWRVSDPHHPQTLGTARGHTNLVFGVAISSDGRTLVSTGIDKR